MFNIEIYLSCVRDMDRCWISKDRRSKEYDMGLNTLSHLQYKIQQAIYQLDALAYNVGI